MIKIILALLIFNIPISTSKEIALSFDDAPFPSSLHFETKERTLTLIRKLKEFNVPPVMIFAAPCRGKDINVVSAQLKAYTEAGHLMANHTCSHSRLDSVGFEKFTKDILEGEKILLTMMSGQKFFRFPYLNESNDVKLRDQVRTYLKDHQYRNGFVTVDTYDYLFNEKINKAKRSGLNIDYKKVEALLVAHIIESIKFYDDLSIKTIGYSPKHVLLLHEMDSTVMFIDSIIKQIQKSGWKIINVADAYTDKLYLQLPKNTYANDGLVSQLAYEKFGEKISLNKFEEINFELNKILGLKENYEGK
jgi:peptidoglycan/xylan/chitin deacetylase (PgdA/CDA1 family)